jgi:hypothetical protein
VRSRVALVVAYALVAGLVATASSGEAHARKPKPKPVCHRRHHQRRVCRIVHVKPHRRVTTTTTTTTASGSTTPATSSTSGGSTTASTSPVQTTATQTTTTTSSSTSAALPRGTEVDESATGQQSPFYAIDAYQRTLAAGTIHFNVYNYDQDPHTLAVADSGGQQLTDAVPVPAGHTGTAVTLTVNLPPGTYVLFCTLPQHAADGMKTTIVVK